MRNLNNRPTTNLWNSPIPYLFGGLGAVLILIAAALVILACSYKKRSSDLASEAQENLPARPAMPLLDAEPKIVVIMAGDDKPTYLAKPVINVIHQGELLQIPTISSSSICTCDQQQVEEAPAVTH